MQGQAELEVEGGGGNMAAAMVAATGACVGLLGVSEMSVSSSSSRAAAPSSLLVSWLTSERPLKKKFVCGFYCLGPILCTHVIYFFVSQSLEFGELFESLLPMRG